MGTVGCTGYVVREGARCAAAFECPTWTTKRSGYSRGEDIEHGQSSVDAGRYPGRVETAACNFPSMPVLCPCREASLWKSCWLFLLRRIRRPSCAFPKEASSRRHRTFLSQGATCWSCGVGFVEGFEFAQPDMAGPDFADRQIGGDHPAKHPQGTVCAAPRSHWHVDARRRQVAASVGVGRKPSEHSKRCRVDKFWVPLNADTAAIARVFDGFDNAVGGAC